VPNCACAVCTHAHPLHLCDVLRARAQCRPHQLQRLQRATDSTHPVRLDAVTLSPMIQLKFHGTVFRANILVTSSRGVTRMLREENWSRGIPALGSALDDDT